MAYKWRDGSAGLLDSAKKTRYPQCTGIVRWGFFRAGKMNVPSFVLAQPPL